MRLPSGDQAASPCQPVSAPDSNSLTISPLFGSQILAMASLLLVAMNFPSGDQRPELM